MILGLFLQSFANGSFSVKISKHQHLCSKVVHNKLPLSFVINSDQIKTCIRVKMTQLASLAEQTLTSQLRNDQTVIRTNLIVVSHTESRPAGFRNVQRSIAPRFDRVGNLSRPEDLVRPNLIRRQRVRQFSERSLHRNSDKKIMNIYKTKSV